jgi:hypothetical protein
MPPQICLPPNDQAKHAEQRLPASLAGLRQIPAHCLTFVGFQHSRHNVHEPPAGSGHNGTTTRVASQETPRLTRVAAA